MRLKFLKDNEPPGCMEELLELECYECKKLFPVHSCESFEIKNGNVVCAKCYKDLK